MYQIVQAQENSLFEAIEKVETKVNNLKSFGWIESGGVSISHAISPAANSSHCSYHYYTIIQAMVKQ